MRDIFKWIWRVMLVILVITMFVNDLGIIQIGLVIGIIVLRVILVETDKTIY